MSNFFLLHGNLHADGIKSWVWTTEGNGQQNTSIFYCLKCRFGQWKLKITAAFYPAQCPCKWSLNDLMFSPKGWVRPARNTSWNLQRHQRQNRLQNRISASTSRLSHSLSYQAARKVRSNWGCPSYSHPVSKTKGLWKRSPPFSSVCVPPPVPSP